MLTFGQLPGISLPRKSEIDRSPGIDAR